MIEDRVSSLRLSGVVAQSREALGDSNYSFVLCEPYVGSICSDKESIGETNGFALRLLRVEDKREGVRV